MQWGDAVSGKSLLLKLKWFCTMKAYINQTQDDEFFKVATFHSVPKKEAVIVQEVACLWQ